MKLLNFAKATQLLALALLLTILPLSVAAQNSNSSNTGGGTTTTQTTRSTETTQQPTSVQVSRSTTQTIDPLWLGIGAVVLLAILAILLLSMRGRTTDNTSVVHERETVVRRE